MNAKSLKAVAETIKVEFVRVGFNPETEQTNFVCVINNERFDFHCGLLACIPQKIAIAGIVTEPIKYLARKYERYGDWAKEKALRQIRASQIKALKNWNIREVREVFEDISKLCTPTAYDLLYCLRLDSEAENVSFSEWCDSLGYNNDSISALNTYNACVENAKKLRKAIGHDKFKELMEAQDE